MILSARNVGAVRIRQKHPKLCQKLLRRPPTLADATDAEIQHFRRWPTPTDARNWLPKQMGSCDYSTTTTFRTVSLQNGIGGSPARSFSTSNSRTIHSIW